MIRTMHSVITKATSRDLTTLAHAKEEMNLTGSTYDARIKRWITEESAAVETYVGRKLIKETWEQHFHGVGIDALRLSLYPVSEILSVTFNETELTSDQWILDGEAGLLVLPGQYCGWYGSGGWWGWYGWVGGAISMPYPSTAIVQYTGGWTLGDDLPADIEAATLMQVGFRKSAGTRDQTIKQEVVPNVLSTTYWIPGVGESAALVPTAASRLEQYREQRI